MPKDSAVSYKEDSSHANQTYKAVLAAVAVDLCKIVPAANS
ncbi:MAG: hypothetical protein QW717_04085 [Candidatus Bathyarchaeia archaeon]